MHIMGMWAATPARLYDDSAPAGPYRWIWADAGSLVSVRRGVHVHILVIEANGRPKPEHVSKKQDGGETEGQILHFGTSESDAGP